MNKTKQTTVGSSKKGSENLDPNASAEAGKGVNNKLKGVSRLPVLAKSLQPSGNDLSQQNRWEQRPLTCKAQKKSICTKPVPFNLSQSRAHSQRNTDIAGGKAPLTPAQLTPGFRSANKSQSAVPRTVGLMEHTSSTNATSLDSTGGHPTITLLHESRSCSQTELSSRLGSITLVPSKLPEDSSLSHLRKDSLINVGVGFNGQASKDKNCIQIVQSASGTQSHASTKAMQNVLSYEGSNTVGAQCVMPCLSTCPTGPGSSNNLPQRVSVKKSQLDIVSTIGNAGMFSPDPTALRSILQHDAVRVVEHVGATPRTSTCPTGRPTSIYSAQRVPIKKPQMDDAAVTESSVSFSPDPSALRSILQNEGVRVAALGGATPRVSTCPTGRGTSIYSAQRVPVKKTKTETTGANRTPVMTWTPQRVANTKPQSMRKLLTAQKMSQFRDSPGFSGTQDPGTELLMHQEQEDVVQRLFDDPDQLDSDQTDKNDVTSNQLLTTSTSHQTIESLTKKENSKSNHCHTEDEGKKTAQPFIQPAHRGSVIVFSSSQRLCGSDRPQKAPVIENILSHITLQSNQNNRSQVTSSSDVTKQINTCTQSQLKAAALRRRHTLEEIILDEECATYTSRLLSCPLQPRCGNPVATTLLFQDSTCFLPIGLSSPIRLNPVPSGSSIRA